MLVDVTGGARLLVGLAERRVAGLDLAMTIHARTGLRLGVLVGAVTAHALAPAPAVDHDCGRFSLLFAMATYAVRGREVGMRTAAVGQRLLAGVDLRTRERMAARAVGFRLVAETLDRLNLRVTDLALLLVTGDAARRRCKPYRISTKLVALSASDVLFDHVQLVTAAQTCALPRGLHLYSAAGRPMSPVGVRARQRYGKHGR